MSKDNSGSAFPIRQHYDEATGHYIQYAHDGMTLRQYYAAHCNLGVNDAVDWLVSTGNEIPTGLQIFEALAVLKFMYADAMILEQNKDYK
jgi:hypothetical protein